jgi:type IV secretory pathway VirB3-like protein
MRTKSTIFFICANGLCVIGITYLFACYVLMSSAFFIWKHDFKCLEILLIILFSY